MQLRVFLTNWLCVAVFSGCSPSSTIERVPVIGEVKFDGAPVQDGRVRFIPQTGNVAPVCIAFIKAGRYEATDRGGVPVGRHRVEIVAYDPATEARRQGGFGGPAPQQLLPARFNSQSELQIEIAPAGGATPLTHSFVLTR